MQFRIPRPFPAHQPNQPGGIGPVRPQNAHGAAVGHFANHLAANPPDELDPRQSQRWFGEIEDLLILIH
jgi:hypothetical protein